MVKSWVPGDWFSGRFTQEGSHTEGSTLMAIPFNRMGRHLLLILCFFLGAQSALALQTPTTGVAAGNPVLLNQFTRGLVIDIIVADPISEVPIPGAVVSVLGTPITATTDHAGRCRIERVAGLGIGALVRLKATKPGYVFGERSILIDELWESAELWLAPAGLYQSPVIPESGGSYTFSGMIDNNPVQFGVDIPAGTFEQPVVIRFTPFPIWAMGWEMADNEYPASQGQFDIVDLLGNEAQSNGGSVGITMNLWAYSGLTIPPGSSGWAQIVFQVYDSNLGQWVTMGGSPPYATMDGGMGGYLNFPNTYFGAGFRAVLRDISDWFDGGSSSPPAPPPSPPAPSAPPDLKTDDGGKECESKFHTQISCGSWGGSGSISQEDGSTARVDASVKSAIDANFSAQSKLAWAKVSGSLGVKVETQVSGGVTLTKSQAVTGSITQGAGAASPCFSGSGDLFLVLKVYSIKLGGIEVGKVRVPSGAATKQYLVFDGTCPGCRNQTAAQPAPDPNNPCD